jgi:hypothetical protein
MIETLTYKGKEYPQFQASGNAARFIIPFAMEVCKGAGLDIGFGKEEWIFPQFKSWGSNKAFPSAFGIDSKYNPEWDAMNLPKNVDHFLRGNPELPNDSAWAGWNYIFSSHCLEHLDDWVRVLDYWYTMIREGGTLFLYLPAYDQEYWRPWYNVKHKNIFTPSIMYDYFLQKGFKKIFVSGVDLNCSFAIMGEK